jgi:hypothetical protein
MAGSSSSGSGDPSTGGEGLVSKWRQKERLKTTAVALVMCLNIGAWVGLRAELPFKQKQQPYWLPDMAVALPWPAPGQRLACPWPHSDNQLV